MSENNETQQVEIVQNDALGAIERAQVDVQISTARKYPRTLSAVKQRMLSFATLDEETAASCFYTLPARRGGDDKPIQGPSVRMAEIALASYQHVKAGSRIIADDGKFTALRFVGDLAKGIKAVCQEKATGETLEGPVVTMDMAKAEGWLDKAGSKWKTMPELMMRYRAAAFFGRLYAPEITMGMHSTEEVIDIQHCYNRYVGG